MSSRRPDLRLYYSFHSEQNNFIYKALNKKKKIKLAFITLNVKNVHRWLAIDHQYMIYFCFADWGVAQNFLNTCFNFRPSQA